MTVLEQPKPHLTVEEVYDRLRDQLQRLGGDVEIVTNLPPDLEGYNPDPESPEQSPQGEHLLVVRLYTLLNSYQIKAVSRDTTRSSLRTGGGGFEGYLGCTMSARRARPGEDWTRGNDLADGPLTRHTLVRIYEDIIACELTRFADECRNSPRPVSLGPSDLASDDEDVARQAEQRWRSS